MTRALCPWAALSAGIPLTLLLDLAVGEALDSATILSEEQVEMTSLETTEPNLEHVFLHLTGRALRD